MRSDWNNTRGEARRLLPSLAEVSGGGHGRRLSFAGTKSAATECKETGKHNQLCVPRGEQGPGTGCFFFREGGSGRKKREQRGGLPGEIVGTAQRFLEAIETAMSE